MTMPCPERRLIAGLLHRPETIATVAQIVRYQHFIEPGLALLFGRLIEMSEAGQPITPATMREAVYRWSHWPAVLDAVELADEPPGVPVPTIARAVAGRAADRRAEYARQIEAIKGKPARVYTEAGEWEADEPIGMQGVNRDEGE